MQPEINFEASGCETSFIVYMPLGESHVFAFDVFLRCASLGRAKSNRRFMIEGGLKQCEGGSCFEEFACVPGTLLVLGWIIAGSWRHDKLMQTSMQKSDKKQ